MWEEVVQLFGSGGEVLVCEIEHSRAETRVRVRQRFGGRTLVEVRMPLPWPVVLDRLETLDWLDVVEGMARGVLEAVTRREDL